MPSNHFILCRPFLLLLSIFPNIRAISHESALCIRWPNYWSSAPALPMNIQGLFPLGWTGWISLQSKGLSKSLLQHHSSKASILQHSAFFMVQLSQPYMTTRKTIALTRQTFVSKVMSLLLSTLSRFVIAFFFQETFLLSFMAAVIIWSDFGAQENKICHCFHFSPICLPWSDGTRCRVSEVLSFLNVEL